MHVLGLMVFTDESEKSAEFNARQCFKQHTPKFTHKCDFFDVGGRWSQLITKKSGFYANTAKVGDIREIRQIPFALCVDGKWHYKGRDVMDVYDNAKWQKRFDGYWKKLPKSASVVVVDLHY